MMTSKQDRPVRPKELLEEKSLWQIYCKSLSLPATSCFNNIATLLWICILTTYAWLTPETTKVLADRVREISADGFSFATTILGFLVAGFTVFATVTKPDLFVYMAKIRHHGSGLPWVKYNFFRFMEVFFVYISFAGTCFCIQLLTKPNGVLSQFLSYITPDPIIIKLLLAKFGFVLLSSFFFYTLLLLKSFIFNIYHVVMTSIRWEMEKEDRNLDKDHKQ